MVAEASQGDGERHSRSIRLLAFSPETGIGQIEIIHDPILPSDPFLLVYDTDLARVCQPERLSSSPFLLSF